MKNLLYLKDKPYFLYKEIWHRKFNAPDWLLKEIFRGFHVLPTKARRDCIRFERIRKECTTQITFPWKALAHIEAEEINLLLERVSTTNWLIYKERSATVEIHIFETIEIKEALDTARQITRLEIRDSFYQTVSVSLNIGFVSPELVPQMRGDQSALM